MKNVNRMPLLRCVDVMTGVLRAKFRADQVAKTNKKTIQTMETFVIEYFKVSTVINSLRYNIVSLSLSFG